MADYDARYRLMPEPWGACGVQVSVSLVIDIWADVAVAVSLLCGSLFRDHLEGICCKVDLFRTCRAGGKCVLSLPNCLDE